MDAIPGSKHGRDSVFENGPEAEIGPAVMIFAFGPEQLLQGLVVMEQAETDPRPVRSGDVASGADQLGLNANRREFRSPLCAVH